MKRKRSSCSSEGSQSSTRNAGSRSYSWLVLGIAFFLVTAGVGGFLVWHALVDPDDRDNSADTERPPSLGEPPIDAAITLHLPAELPETAEEFNEELLAVGRQLVESLPNEPESYAQMALICMEVGRENKVLEIWKQALKQDEGYSAAYLGIGALYAERSENDQAVSALRKAIDLAPESEEAYQLLSEVLLRQGKAEESREVAQECVRRFPANYENHFWLGQAYLELGEHAEARRCHEEAVRLNPDWTQSYYSLSVACADLGDAENAKRYRERFAELKSIDQAADRDRTRAYDDLSSCRRAVVKRHILAGAIELRFDHPRMAEADWLRAGAIDRSDVPTREALVLLYQRQGRAGAALQVLEELVQLKPNNAEYLLQQGRLLFELARWRDAEKTLEQALHLTPDSAEVNLRLAQIYLRAGSDVSAALSCAEKAARLNPSVDSLRILAAIRGQAGDYRGARSALKQALSLSPYDPELRQAYEQLLETE